MVCIFIQDRIRQNRTCESSCKTECSQDKTDAGKDWCWQDRSDAGQDGCRKGLMQAGQVGCRTGWMQDRMDAEKDWCRQDRSDAGQVGCRTEWMQERMDAGHNGYRPLRIHRTTKRMHERRMFFAELLPNRTINDASIFKTHSPYCTFAIHAKSLGQWPVLRWLWWPQMQIFPFSYCNYSFWIQGSTFLDQVINKIQATVPHSTEPLSQAALTHDNPTLSEP